MKLLTLTSLFPGRAMPRHGVFVKERLRDYRLRYDADIRVVAPVPWVPPFASATKYAAFKATPTREDYDGFSIEHPRYLVLPKIGMALQGIGYERGVRDTVLRLRVQRPFDVLDAHYAYPDGFAAALLRARLRVPMTLTVRGTDVNLLPRYPSVRGQIRFALRQADAVIAVSQALAELAIEAGADAGKVTVLRNGVDVDVFAPLDREACRTRWSVPHGRRVVASVGQLIERKGHHLLLDAVAAMPAQERPQVLIVGDGEMRAALEAQIARLQLSADARLLGGVDHAELASVYSAADLLVLASSREGWPNVLLESMACGTPVVATAVHGSPEVVASDAVGILVRERSALALTAALRAAFARSFDRTVVRAFAMTRTWRETSDGLDRVYRAVAGGGVRA